jgi:hypothetical protein
LVNYLGYGSTTAWFANIFTAIATEFLTAVSFYTVSPNSSYEIYIYTNVTSDPISGLLSGSEIGIIPIAGYHTIPLTTPVSLTSGQMFSVVVRLTTPGYNYPIPIEMPTANYSSQATAQAGESYTSNDGTSWIDITAYYQNTNVSLKAFTLSNLFSDVLSSHWAYNYIIAIYNNHITVGCSQNPLKYCPDDNVTRGQMAAFIIRAKYGENFSYTTTPYFTDVPSTHTFFKYVQKLKDVGITAVSGIYEVDSFVTRGQMAAFIIRAKYGENFSYPTTPYFSDVPSTHTFFKYVQKLRDEGITTLTGTYYVNNNVTRAEMAAFLSRAFLGME